MAITVADRFWQSSLLCVTEFSLEVWKYKIEIDGKVVQYQVFGDKQRNLLKHWHKKTRFSSIFGLIMIFFFTGERKDVYVLAQEYLGSIYRYITDTVVSSYSDACKARHAIFPPSQATTPGVGVHLAKLVGVYVPHPKAFTLFWPKSGDFS